MYTVCDLPEHIPAAGVRVRSRLQLCASAAATHPAVMAKRRAEDTLLHDSPSKRCHRPLYGVDMPLESGAPTGGLGPPSLLALLGSRCRKRPHYFEEKEEEAVVHRKPPHGDARKHAASVVTLQTSGGFQDRRSCSTATGNKKRPREDGTGPKTVAAEAEGSPDGETNAEDCTYNSFQYWRVPLPELDLSLLEDANDQSRTKEKSKVKDSTSDGMET